MTDTTENLSDVSTTKPVSTIKNVGDEIDADTFQKMLDILDDLVDHAHIFYDDYSTACNCNCNCNCTRGIL